MSGFFLGISAVPHHSTIQRLLCAMLPMAFQFPEVLVLAAPQIKSNLSKICSQTFSKSLNAWFSRSFFCALRTRSNGCKGLVRLIFLGHDLCLQKNSAPTNHRWNKEVFLYMRLRSPFFFRVVCRRLWDYPWPAPYLQCKQIINYAVKRCGGLKTTFTTRFEL